MYEIEVEGELVLPNGWHAHLANYYDHRPTTVGNLWVTDSAGREIWRSKSQGNDGLFTGMRREKGGVLRAATWGGYSYQFAIETGEILSTEFVK